MMLTTMLPECGYEVATYSSAPICWIACRVKVCRAAFSGEIDDLISEIVRTAGIYGETYPHSSPIWDAAMSSVTTA